MIESPPSLDFNIIDETDDYAVVDKPPFLLIHPTKPDGIYYRSRHDPARTACALFDHCSRYTKILEDYGSWAEQPRLLGAILDHYGFGTDL